MILITLQYIPVKYDVAFLNIKQEAIRHIHYRIAFFSHVYSSILVLILGFSQFSKFLRNKLPKIHKMLGKLYIGLVLFVASPSGLVMAVYANGGISSKISFSVQAILWFTFTYIAFTFAKKLEWKKHRNFMMRSYALTFSAISLRLFKWIIVGSFQLPPMETYKIVSWLGWIVNLALVEIYIISRITQKQIQSYPSRTL
jgi:uncharacterized membrane protein